MKRERSPARRAGKVGYVYEARVEAKIMVIYFIAVHHIK
jgi:hypothetical protein